MASRLDDPLAGIRELASFDIRAGDGHFHEAACHDPHEAKNPKPGKKKANMKIEVIGLTPDLDKADPRNAGVNAHEPVGPGGGGAMIRRVTYTDAKGTTWKYLTNEMKLPAWVIVLLFKQRWDIEIGKDGADLVFEINTPTGASYRLVTSTDLAGWTVVPGQADLTTGIVRLSDATGQGAGLRRFYRLEEE